jgi:hypothetical protein
MSALGSNGDHRTAAGGLPVHTELPIDAQDIALTALTTAKSDLDAAWSREELDVVLPGGDSRGDGNARGGAHSDTCPDEIDWDQFVEVD